ncbi:MAG: hypothetical protein V9E98_14880 [Candidatus Nanopelagicales bacterium]
MPPRRKDIPDASLSAEFAERMAAEQKHRDWSDARLASRASEVYPISASTIWKIKYAKPRRRLDLDEADAIVQAFGYTDVREFVHGTHLRQLVAIVVDLSSPIDQLGQIAAEIDRLLARMKALRSDTWSEVPEANQEELTRLARNMLDEANIAQGEVAEALQRFMAQLSRTQGRAQERL